MNKYKPSELRRKLLDPFWIPRMLESPIEKSQEVRSIGAYAQSCVQAGAEAYLAGLPAEGKSLLEKAQLWLETSIAEREMETRPLNTDQERPYARWFDVAVNYEFLALARWMNGMEMDKGLFSTACDWYLKYFQGCQPREIGWKLPVFIAADQLENLKSAFDKSGNEPPTKLSKIKSPAKVCYLFSTHVLNHSPDKDSLKKAFEDFLRYQIPVCLGINRQGLGTPRDIPLWMLIYDRWFGGLSSLQALRRALDFVEVDPA
jgi:hypothetical protein